MGQSLVNHCYSCMKASEERHHVALASPGDDEEENEEESPYEDMVRKECAKVLLLYELGKLVGRGATSKVYEVVRKHRTPASSPVKTDRRCGGCSSRRLSDTIKPFTKLACKVIDKRRLIGLSLNTIDMDVVLGQLRKEISILKSCDHPNIVAFQDFIETKDAMYLVTEYASGSLRLHAIFHTFETSPLSYISLKLDSPNVLCLDSCFLGDELFEHIVRHGPLSEDLCREVMRGVFSAVSYLHDRGVLHRDIKAENVIIQLQETEKEGVLTASSVKLIDFGFSTMLRRTDVTGSFLGTGGYLAPEIRQQRLYGVSIDNWALGTLLYCSIAGHLPFGSDFDAITRSTSRTSCQKMFILHMEGIKWNHIRYNKTYLHFDGTKPDLTTPHLLHTLLLLIPQFTMQRFDYKIVRS